MFELVEGGFYWVRGKELGDVFVAQYGGPSYHCWLTCGSDRDFDFDKATIIAGPLTPPAGIDHA